MRGCRPEFFKESHIVCDLDSVLMKSFQMFVLNVSSREEQLAKRAWALTFCREVLLAASLSTATVATRHAAKITSFISESRLNPLKQLFRISVNEANINATSIVKYRQIFFFFLPFAVVWAQLRIANASSRGVDSEIVETPTAFQRPRRGLEVN